jgi:hypothetical protein
MSEDFSKEVRELWTQAEEADKDNRKEALTDLKFAAGEHWDERVKQHREQMGIARYGFPLPCLTINTLPQFVGQVIGDRRANATSIKVLPREDGDVKIAEVRSELIRSIELQSKADRVYNQAFEQAVTCGIGNFRIDLDYAYEDAFERDLFIRPIANPLAVLWDPMAADPTGKDAGYCFVSDKISRDEFKRRFPDASESSEMDATGLQSEGWMDRDTVRLAEYWKIDERERTFAMMLDGSVEDVTDLDRKVWLPMVARGPSGPVIREKAKCKYAVMVMTNGIEQLSDPFELKLPRLPIIRVMGREVWIGDKRSRFGLVRFARDPARLKDYDRSVIAELLMLAPRANYIAPAAAVEGRTEDWPNTLVYNDNAPIAPQAITGQLLPALMQHAEMHSQDMKDTTGIHEASLGMNGNETSGIAIQRRQNEGDIAAIVYHDNMNGAMQEGGEVINALIPIVYDTARTIRTVGEDEGVKLLRVNDPQARDGHIDLATGRYDVTISTAPAYATRRQEAAAQLMELSSRAPQLLEAAGDLIIGELDIPGGAKIQERVKRMIPPQVLGDDADDGKSEEEKQRAAQAAQQAQQKQQAMEQLQFESAQADTDLKKAQAREANAKALKAEAEAMAAGQGDGPDPVAMDKNLIAAFDAQTRRISALGKNDFALPPEANAVLAARITEAILQALGMEGELPPHVAVGIAGSSLNEVAEQKAVEQEQRDQAAESAKQAGKEAA